MDQLFGSHTSPYVRHCRVALMQAGIEVEFVETDYAASAEKSPTRRVPFLQTGDLTLTDSTSILRWVREQAGGMLLADLPAFDRYLMVNTALDATVNLFLLERDGLSPDEVPYLARQSARVAGSLEALDRQFAGADPDGDDGLRLACFLSWAAFRHRFDVRSFENLDQVLKRWDAHPDFAVTHPGRAG